MQHFSFQALAAAVPQRYWVELFIAVALYAVVIFVYLCGHLVFALLRDVRIEQFGLFFGPAIVKFRISNILFRINVLPLGGYVKFRDNPDESGEPAVPGHGSRFYGQLSSFEHICLGLAAPLTTMLIASVLLGTAEAIHIFSRGFVEIFRGAINPDVASAYCRDLLRMVSEHHYLKAIGILAAVNTTINMLPVPSVIGGVILFELFTLVTRKPVPIGAQKALSVLTFPLVLAWMVWLSVLLACAHGR